MSSPSTHPAARPPTFGERAPGPGERPPRPIPPRLQERMQTAIAWVDHDLCVGCSYCQLACPYDTIDLTDGLATIRDDCTACWVCLSYCPVDAISQATRPAGE